MSPPTHLSCCRVTHTDSLRSRTHNMVTGFRPKSGILEEIKSRGQIGGHRQDCHDEMYQDILQSSTRCLDEKIAEERELPSMFSVTGTNGRKQPDTRQRFGRSGNRFCPYKRQRGIRMALKAPPKGLKRINIRTGFKEYTYLGCPLTKNRSPWCFRTCKPNVDGTGLCGRVAPHAFKSRIQQGIEDFKRRQADSATLHCHRESTCSKDA